MNYFRFVVLAGLHYVKYIAISIALVTLFLAGGCVQEGNSEITIQDLHWLEGRWMTDDSTYHEIWWPDTRSLRGEGYTLTAGDTTFREILDISPDDGILTYWAQIPGMNNDNPIGFKFIGHDKDSLIFENREHDYPNRIVYVRKAAGHLFIRVEDYKGEKGFNIDMEKIEK